MLQDWSFLFKKMKGYLRKGYSKRCLNFKPHVYSSQGENEKENYLYIDR